MTSRGAISRRIVRAALVCLAATWLMAPTPEVEDPEPVSDALQLAWRLGGIEALAEICSAPPSTFQPIVEEARALLPELLRRAGQGPAEIKPHIEHGWHFELDRHRDAPDNAPPCTAFRRIVSGFKGSVAHAKGEPVLPLAPYDRLGWQQRIREREK